MVHPIIDEYYNYNPYHSRSSKFVQDKGLITNEKGTPNPRSTLDLNLNLPISSINEHAKSPTQQGSSTRDSIATTLIPSLHSSIAAPQEIPPLQLPLSQVTQASKPNRAQEQGDTKRKRKSLSIHEPEEVDGEQEPFSPSLPSIRGAAYGDPSNISQYFPELGIFRKN